MVTIRIHKEGVWALAVIFLLVFIFTLYLFKIEIISQFQATENFSHVISGGRDRRIYKTDLRNTSNSSNTTLIAEERNPVLKICPVPDFSGIWVATDESSINYWVGILHLFLYQGDIFFIE